MKPLLFVLLAASLIANVALLVSSRRPPVPPAPAAATLPSGGDTPANPGASPASSPAPTIVATKRSDGAAAPTGAVPFAWPAVHTDEDLHRVVAGLRAAGYPPAALRAVVNQLLNERFAARQPNAGQPFWKRNTPSPEMVAAQTALSHERQALFEALLGPDSRPSALLDAEARERRYGALPDDKIDAITRIERDYNELTAETWAKRRGNAVTNSDMMMQTQQLMEKEKLADLAGILTPEELAQYEMRNSNSARTLINSLQNVDLSAAEYARLFEAQKAFDTNHPLRGVLDATTFAQRQLAQLSLNEEARTVLGDARFYAYLEGTDRNYATVAQALAKHPTVTPATAYQVYQLQIQLQGLMAQSTRSGPVPPEKIEELRTTVATYNSRLESLVGPDVAEVFRNQGMGRIFNNFRQLPRPAAPAGGTPLVPVGK